jgi:type VI secretion system protein ImpF
MPRNDYDIRVTPSLLDRLRVRESGASADSSGGRTQSLHELEKSVARDLKRLLNTRQSNPPRRRDLGRGAKGKADALDAPFAYGLPDFSSASALVDDEKGRMRKLDQSDVRRAIEIAIKRFEPRLILKEVVPLEVGENERAFRFRIDAWLKVEPAPERVTYDTVFHIHNGEYKVEAH